MARITLYKQSDSMQCGIACLQMICKYHGRDVNHTFLSEMCCATHEGVSLLGINNVATDIGFKTVSGRISVKGLTKGELTSDICDILTLPQRVSNPSSSPNFFRLNNDTPSVVAVHRWERVSKEYPFP